MDMLAFWAAVATGLITMTGTLIGSYFQNKTTRENFEHGLDIRQAVTDTKIDELTREVREQKSYASRVPVIEEQIKNIDIRVSDIEEVLKKA